MKGMLVIAFLALSSFSLVFRNQLPRKNDTYSYSPPPDTAPPKGSFSILKLKSGAHLCRVCGCLAPKACSKCHFAHYCCKPHQIVDWKLGHKQVCSVQLELSDAAIPDHSFLFPEYEILIEPELVSEGESEQEADGDDEENDPGSGMGIMGAVVECEDYKALQAMAKKETKEDKIFECFKNKIASAPKQVLRYCRGGDPIWISCEQIPQETDIPNCSCGAKRIFEFQVMPQLLNHLKVDSLEDSIDWGTLAVFTCADNCGDEQQYTEEFLWKQDVAVDPV